jgi:hypothetical protein
VFSVAVELSHWCGIRIGWILGEQRTSLRDVKALLGVDVPHFAGVLWVSRRMYLSLPEPCRPSSTFAQAQIRSPPCSLGEKLTGSPASLRMAGELRPIFAHILLLRCETLSSTVQRHSNTDSYYRETNGCSTAGACCSSKAHVVGKHMKLGSSPVSVASITVHLLSVVAIELK